MKHNKNLCIQGFIINELKHTYIYFTKLVRYYFLNLQLIFSRVKVKLRCYYALLIQLNLEESITSVTAQAGLTNVSKSQAKSFYESEMFL